MQAKVSMQSEKKYILWQRVAAVPNQQPSVSRGQCPSAMDEAQSGPAVVTNLTFS